jgi:hypothetical protein
MSVEFAISGRSWRPASMLLVIPQLVWPEILVEVEIIAAKA